MEGITEGLYLLRATGRKQEFPLGFQTLRVYRRIPLPYGRPGRRGAKIAGGAGSPAPPEILGPADLWGEIAQDSRGGRSPAGWVVGGAGAVRMVDGRI